MDNTRGKAADSVLPRSRSSGSRPDFRIFESARENQPALVAVLVHQWTDGEGNWDIFAITPRLALAHADRIWGLKDRA